MATRYTPRANLAYLPLLIAGSREDRCAKEQPRTSPGDVMGLVAGRVANATSIASLGLRSLAVPLAPQPHESTDLPTVRGAGHWPWLPEITAANSGVPTMGSATGHGPRSPRLQADDLDPPNAPPRPRNELPVISPQRPGATLNQPLAAYIWGAVHIPHAARPLAFQKQ
jgi:hypothetical protein